MTRNRPTTAWLLALVALATALVVVVTTVRATRCARAAAIVEGASHESANVHAADRATPTGELPVVPAAENDDGARTCTSAFCPIPSHRHAMALAPAAAQAPLLASDDIPPRRPPSTIERPPRS